MRNDNTKQMAVFGRGISSMLVFGAVGTMQVAAAVPTCAYLQAQDWPAVLLTAACVNLFNAVAYYVIWSFWFKVPR